MHVGVSYHPELWVHPPVGSQQDPEAHWREDAKLMVDAGVSVVRLGARCWGTCEPSDGNFEFGWLQRAMDILAEHGLKVVLVTPTAVPPPWLIQKHPEILHPHTTAVRKHPSETCTVCLNSDVYWDLAKRIVTQMANALGKHPNLIAWQIDNVHGDQRLELSFNEDSKRDWHFWLEAKYETIERMNNLLGLRWSGQIVRDWKQVPVPAQPQPTYNPALELDWTRFCSDTIVQFVKMQADVLREITPDIPITTAIPASGTKVDHFDLADVVDFVSGTIEPDDTETAVDSAIHLDRIRSLKRAGGKCPANLPGFWVILEHPSRARHGQIHAPLRPGLLRTLAYQCIGHGANTVVFMPWRQPRIGPEKFLGGVLPHHVRRENRTYREVAQLGEEFKLLAPALKNTTINAQVAILYTFDNQWATDLARFHSKHLLQDQHIRLFYEAFHEKNIPVDFARPLDDLARYKLVIAPSLHLLAGAEADALKLYVQNGGVLVTTCNTGLVDEHHMAPETGFPMEITDLLGLEVLEFDLLGPDEENHLIFKGEFPASQMHPGRHWCDVIEPKDCEVLATFASSFYAGRPAMTMNRYGLGRAIHIGTVSHRPFYHDLVKWLRELCNIQPTIKTPEAVEICIRESQDSRIYIVINRGEAPARIQFIGRMEDLITGAAIAGTYDLPPFGVLVAKEI